MMEFFRIRLIRQAHGQLHDLTGTPATWTVLELRMELYGILAEEVAETRSNLVTYLECRRANSEADGMCLPRAASGGLVALSIIVR
jgi:hypothetical protein